MLNTLNLSYKKYRRGKN